MAAAFLLATGAQAQSAEALLPLAAAEQARLDAAGVIGKQIYDYDQAAWITSDVLVKRIPRNRFPSFGGWVVEPRGDGALVVSYYGMRDGTAFIMFIGVAKGGNVIEERVFTEADHVALSPIQKRMADAKQVAMSRVGGTGHNPCAPAAFNPVVLTPVAANDPVTVYLLTPQTKSGYFPFGGHFRIDVDKAGRTITDRAFTNSCVDLEKPPTIDPARPNFGFITHLLDPTPTEIHVFLSLWMHNPVIVGTSDNRIWLVDGTQVSLVANDIKDLGKR